MSIFGRKKQAQAQQQPQNTSEKPKAEPYKHVPKHAAADSVSTSTANAGDRTAQRMAIIAASRKRMESSEKPDYSIKGASYIQAMNGSGKQSATSPSIGHDRQSSQATKSSDVGSLTQKSRTKSGSDSLKGPEPLTVENADTSRTQTITREQTQQTSQTTRDSGYGSARTSSATEPRNPSDANAQSGADSPGLSRSNTRFLGGTSLMEELSKEPVFARPEPKPEPRTRQKRESTRSEYRQEPKSAFSEKPPGLKKPRSEHAKPAQFVSRLDPGPSGSQFAAPADIFQAKPKQARSEEPTKTVSQNTERRAADARERGRASMPQVTQPESHAAPNDTSFIPRSSSAAEPPNTRPTQSAKASTSIIPEIRSYVSQPVQVPASPLAEPSINKSYFGPKIPEQDKEQARPEPPAPQPQPSERQSTEPNPQLAEPKPRYSELNRSGTNSPLGALIKSSSSPQAKVLSKSDPPVGAIAKPTTPPPTEPVQPEPKETSPRTMPSPAATSRVDSSLPKLAKKSTPPVRPPRPDERQLLPSQRSTTPPPAWSSQFQSQSAAANRTFTLPTASSPPAAPFQTAMRSRMSSLPPASSLSSEPPLSTMEKPAIPPLAPVPASQPSSITTAKPVVLPPIQPTEPVAQSAPSMRSVTQPATSVRSASPPPPPRTSDVGSQRSMPQQDALPQPTQRTSESASQRSLHSQEPLPQATHPQLERITSFTSERSGRLPPLSSLEGFKVNKRGKILDEEGEAIGELFQGDLIDCVRQRVNAQGEVVDEYGAVVGLVQPLPRGMRPPSSPYSTQHHQTPWQSEYPYASFEQSRWPAARSDRGESISSQPGQQLYGDYASRPINERTKSFVSPPDLQGAVEIDGMERKEVEPVMDLSDAFSMPFGPSASRRHSDSPSALIMKAQGYEERRPSQSKLPEPGQDSAHPLKHWASRNLDPGLEENKSRARPPSQGSDSAGERRGSNTPRPKSTSLLAESHNPGGFRATIGPSMEDLQAENPSLFPTKSQESPAPAQPSKPLVPAGAAAAAATSASTYAQSPMISNPMPARHTSLQFNTSSPGPRMLGVRNMNHQPLRKSPLASSEATPPTTAEGPDDDARTMRSVQTTRTAQTMPAKPRSYFTHAGRITVDENEESAPSPEIPRKSQQFLGPEAAAAVKGKGPVTSGSKRRSIFGFPLGRKGQVAAAR